MSDVSFKLPTGEDLPFEVPDKMWVDRVPATGEVVILGTYWFQVEKVVTEIVPNPFRTGHFNVQYQVRLKR